MPEAASQETTRRRLLRGATLLTLDAEATIHRGGDLLLEGERIRHAGPPLLPAELRELEGLELVDFTGCLVLPGLIQAHLHLGQTLFRGLAEGRRLLPWLRERIWPLEAAHDDESAYWCTLLGASECLLGGTTTIQDIGLGPGARGLLEATAESGLRALTGLCLMDDGDGLPAGLAGPTDAVLARALDLAAEFDRKGRLRWVLNPRFVLSCSDALWGAVVELAQERGWRIHTHALEQEEETVAVRRLKRGRDEIEYFGELGVLEQGCCIAHGVHLSSAHLDTLSGRRGFSVAHCPSANLKLGSGIADLLALRQAGIAVGIGADGAPCNNDLDVLEEIRLAALLQAVRHRPGALSGLDALRLATSDGARALGLEAELGSLEAGKLADLLVLDTVRPELWETPGSDLHDLVTYGASRASVRSVWIGGVPVVDAGVVRGLDLAAIRRRSVKALPPLLERAGLGI